MNTRLLSAFERALLQKLLSQDFSGASALRDQASVATVRTVDADGSLHFSVPDQCPVAECSYRVPVEAKASDVDGVEINALLHVQDGMLHELEFYKVDHSAITRPLPPVDRWAIDAAP